MAARSTTARQICRDISEASSQRHISYSCAKQPRGNSHQHGKIFTFFSESRHHLSTFWQGSQLRKEGWSWGRGGQLLFVRQIVVAFSCILLAAPLKRKAIHGTKCSYMHVNEIYNIPSTYNKKRKTCKLPYIYRQSCILIYKEVVQK